MNKNIEIFLVLVYNLALLAGASYLVYYKEANPWIYALVLCFGASWSDKTKEEK
jgi:hypothetical protein